MSTDDFIDAPGSEVQGPFGLHAPPEGDPMEKVFSSDGTAIAFDRSGDGPPLILVSGALQHRAMDSSTARLAELLAPHLTVFHYDRRGRGDSGDSRPYAVDREVDDLGALIDEAGGWAFVYGMSSGGALALEAAAQGLAVTKLALYEPPFAIDNGDHGAAADFEARLRELTSSGRRGDAVEFFLTESGMPVEGVARMRDTPIWPRFESVAHTLLYDITIMSDQESLLAERVPSITAPTLLIDGGASAPWARGAVEVLAGRLPHPRRRTLEGQTHEVAPDPLAPVLKEFFAG
jgi:pimeloyl-ACP methyl ester carboxylesterase